MSDLIYNFQFVFLHFLLLVYIIPVGAIRQLFAYFLAKATVDSDDAADNEDIPAADLHTDTTEHSQELLLVMQMV